jgi:hypothetical protein
MLTMSMPPPVLYRRSAFQVALLMFVTGGIYIFWWSFHVRRWCSGVLEKPDQPLWKSIALIVPIFNLFLLYDLGLIIRTVARRQDPSASTALPWLGVSAFFIAALWRLPDPFWFVSLLAFVPIAIMQLALVKAEFSLAAFEALPTKFHWVEWIVIVLGGLMWLLAVAGTSLMPDDAGKIAQPAWFSGAVSGAAAALVVIFGILSRRLTNQATSQILAFPR